MCFFVLFLSLHLIVVVFRLMGVWVLQLAQVIEKYNITADNI
jgi:cytoskeletal protein RodZ